MAEPRCPVDPALARHLAAWRTGAPASPVDGLDLGRRVTREIRRIGRHALPEPVLAALAEIADRHHGRDPFLDAFLDAVLARHRDRFRNAGYLALGLLEEIGHQTALGPERLSALLLADVVRHENRHRGDVEPALRRKRIRQATRFVGTVERSPAEGAAPPATLAGDWLDLTVLPVSTEHDEYVFIRALQAHELVFTTLGGLVRSATAALRAGRLDEAVAHLRRAAVVFERASLLFRLVATMRAESVASFRRVTEGTNAIRSEAYRRFQLACDELGRARPAARDDAVADLEQVHERWTMLGDAAGSGYTAGVPYLAACREDRLVVVRGGSGPSRGSRARTSAGSGPPGSISTTASSTPASA